MSYAETPLGSALAQMGQGECCAVATVLECGLCGRVFADDRPGADDTGWCGACEHGWRYQANRHPGPLQRRERRPGEPDGTSYRW